MKQASYELYIFSAFSLMVAHLLASLTIDSIPHHTAYFLCHFSNIIPQNQPRILVFRKKTR